MLGARTKRDQCDLCRKKRFVSVCMKFKINVWAVISRDVFYVNVYGMTTYKVRRKPPMPKSNLLVVTVQPRN